MCHVYVINVWFWKYEWYISVELYLLSTDTMIQSTIHAYYKLNKSVFIIIINNTCKQQLTNGRLCEIDNCHCEFWNWQTRNKLGE